MVHCPPLFRFALATIAVAATAAHAQPAWRPERPVEVVVPAAAGGSIDATARLIQRVLQSARLVETPVLAVNKAGGGGRVAVHHMDQHAGDGHYLLTSTMGIMTNHIRGRSATTWSDYTPPATLFSEHMTLVVKPDYAGSKESAQRMARLYAQLNTALVDAGLAKER